MKKRINMKKNRSYSLRLSFVFALCCLIGAGCQKDMENFDNKVFISNETVETLLLKGDDTGRGIIQTAIAQREQTNIEVVYKADLSLVDQYNRMFNDKAVALPEACYEIEQPKSTIAIGGIKGNDVIVHFKELSTLNRDLLYVLPVTISSTNLDVLSSARTRYFVIKGAALINVVANIKNNKLSLSSSGSKDALNNLSTITAEALIRVDKFGKLISTIMGIEGHFLIRIGDAGLPDNQIQLATSRGKVTDSAWTVNTNEWTHLALTFDQSNHSVELYINGVKKGGSKSSSYSSTVDWGNDNFWIGYSYEDGRFLDGDICECRVWNRILTQEEIQAKDHFYAVSPEAEGLVAYWKFDEGAGIIVKDHTKNRNDITSSKPLTWKAIELPAK